MKSPNPPLGGSGGMDDIVSWAPKSPVSWTVGLHGPYTMELTFKSWADLESLNNTLVQSKKARPAPPTTEHEGNGE